MEIQKRFGVVSIKTLKVLSVDWDYFINATYDMRLELFPDGGRELPPQIGDYVWLTRYADERLKNIDILAKDLKIVVDTIKASSNCKIVVYDSHVNCYSELSTRLSFEDNLVLYNIDFHSDVYTQTLPGLDCGNWLYHVIHERPLSKFFWVNSPLSDEKVGRGMISKLKQVNISKIKGVDFDFVFICRSDMWSPPHLDKQFISFCNNFKDRVVIPNPYVMQDRFNSVFAKNLNDYKKMVSNMYKK